MSTISAKTSNAGPKVGAGVLPKVGPGASPDVGPGASPDVGPGASPDVGPGASPDVGLFVTCLVDLYRPNVGFAAIRLLEAAGCSVTVPAMQTCCGQPAFNAGDDQSTCALARQQIEAFEGLDYVVVPSGSCAGMIREHYPALLADDPEWADRAASLAGRCHELTSFLVDVLGVAEVDAAFEHGVTYHDACAGLREVGVREQPRRLLGSVRGLELKEMEDTDVCCGFGGTFCIKFPDISERMATDKVALAKQSGADTLLGGDLGCLLNISGRSQRLDVPMRAYHVAEVLAGMADIPAIGESSLISTGEFPTGERAE